MVRYAKMDRPHINISCGTENRISNPMGIGLGIDYVTGWEILKWTPPQHQNLKRATKTNFHPMGIGLGIDYVTWWEILRRIPPTSNLHVGHKITIRILLV